MSADVDRRLDALDRRIDMAAEWHRVHDTRLEALEADVAAIVAGLGRLERRIAEAEEAISALAALHLGAIVL